MTSLQKPRVVWADALRVLAILFVIMIHTAAPLFTTQPVGSAGFTVGWLLDCLVQPGVPLFVMVSGVFMLDERRQVTIRRAVCHYALPMVGFYALWSVVYALANKVVEPVAFGGAAVDGALVKTFLMACVEGAYHLWYLPMIVGLYLLTPLLRRFVKRDDPRPAVYFVLLSLVFGFLVPAAVELAVEFLHWDSLAATVDTFRLDVVAVFPGYYVAGWRPSRSRRRTAYLLGLLGLVGMVVMTGWVSYRHGEGVKLWMEPASLLCGVYAAGLFAAFCWGLGAWQPRPAVAKAISRLAKLSFGVYILHVEVQALFKMAFPYTGAPLAYALVQWAAVTVISFAAAWVVSLIPGLRRTLRGG